jgi:hypothetical protein
MTASTIITGYLAEGLAANRPATPSIGSGVISFYYATDTTTLYFYDLATSAWIQIQTGSGGSSGITASGVTGQTDIPFAVGQNVPLSSGFSFVNQNSATLTNNTNGPLVWQCPTAVSGTLSLFTKSFTGSSPHVWTAHAKVSMQASGNCQVAVVGVTDGTKYSLLCLSGDNQMRVMDWNTSTSFNTTQASATFGSMPDEIWVRVTWTVGTTTLLWQWSPDGFTWNTFYSTSSPTLTPTGWAGGANLTSNLAAMPDTISYDYCVMN